MPWPAVVTSSMSGSGIEELNASERKAGSPMATWPHGPMFRRLSHTCKKKPCYSEEVSSGVLTSNENDLRL